MYSFKLISSIIKKKKYHKEWLSKRIESDRDNFKELRTKCFRLSRIDRLKYIEDVEFNSKKNPKSIWKYVDSLSNVNKIPDEMYLGDMRANNSGKICNLFAKNFELV